MPPFVGAAPSIGTVVGWRVLPGNLRGFPGHAYSFLEHLGHTAAHRIHGHYSLRKHITLTVDMSYEVSMRLVLFLIPLLS